LFELFLTGNFIFFVMIKPEIKVSIGPQKHGFLTILTMFRHIFESFTGIFTFFTFFYFIHGKIFHAFLINSITNCGFGKCPFSSLLKMTFPL